MDHVVDLLPELRIFVGLEHLIRGRVGENSIEDCSKVDGEDDGDAKDDPEVDG